MEHWYRSEMEWTTSSKVLYSSIIIQILGNITQFVSQIWVRRMLDRANMQIYALMMA